MERTIEIPFGAKDSELKGWEYTIPENMEAEINNGKIIVKQKESEDERIRKNCVHFLELQKGHHADTSEIDECISYLEKQKEKNTLSTEETELNSIAFLEQLGYTCVPPGAEQKPVARENDFVSKPIEWSDNFEENVRNLLHDKLTWHSEDGSISSTVFIDDKTLKDIICGIWFYVGKEALKYPNKELNVTEWSEEDERMIRCITNRIESDIQYGNELTKAYGNQEIVWLKLLKNRGNFLKSNNNSPWKPSEEQMEALENEIKYELCAGLHTRAGILQTLYDDLKNYSYEQVH